MKKKSFGRLISLFMLTAVLGLGIYLYSSSAQELVGWRDLGKFLDNISGWEPEGDINGSTTSMSGFSISQASRDFTKDGKSIEIEIIDSGLNQMVFAAVKMAMSFEVDSSEEYIKKITIKNFPGMEQYDYDDKDGEVNLIIADRFLVKIEGSDLEDCSLLKDAAENMDLEGLAQLAK
jgi:hypothetical protein